MFKKTGIAEKNNMIKQSDMIKKNVRIKNILFKIVVAVIVMFMAFVIDASIVMADTAENIDISVNFSNGSSGQNVLDGSYDTCVTLNEGDSAKITLNSPAKRVYIIWGKLPKEWTLEIGDKKETRGKNGFLHEYIEFDEDVTEFSIIADNGNTISDIYCYGDGELPEDVQAWEPMCDKADILLLSTHADDELLFLGGIIPYYAGEKGLDVQVVYFSQYWEGGYANPLREHEKLDGLWHAGVRHYPLTAEFRDEYAGSLEQAIGVFGEEKPIEFVVEMLRKFKPLVAVAQDVNGEYGHGTHMLTSYAMRKAVEVSMDANSYPDSATKYGVWDVPKTYLHIYSENQITLDCRKPLDKFGGKNTVEVLSESYKKHVSQQWCWYYVDDEYEYSCAKFGLYRTTVGADTTNDIMEHVVDYKTQAEEESKKAYEESIKESQSIAESQSREEASKKEQESIAEALKEKEEGSKLVSKILIIVLIVVVAVIVIYFVLLIRIAKKSKKRNKKRRNRTQPKS